MKSVKTKIMIPVLVMAGMFIGFMALQIAIVYTNLGQVREMKNVYFAATSKSDALKLGVVQVQQWLTDISATRAADGFADGFDEAESHAQTVRTLIHELTSLDPSSKGTLEEISESFERYYETGKKMASEYIALGPEGGNKMMGDFDKVASDINLKVDDFIVQAGENITQSISAIEDSILNSVILAVVAVAAVLLLSVVAYMVIGKMVIFPIKQVRNAANQLSKGKLDIQIDYQSADEMGQLADDMRITARALHEYIADISQCMEQLEQGNLSASLSADFQGDFVPLRNTIVQFREKLSEMLLHINRSAEQVYLGSDQVSSGAQALANGAMEQSAAVEQLTATIAAISDNVSQNAGLATQADQLAQNVGQEVQDSNHQMDQLVEAMNEINTSSDQISKIIKAIDDIAFQTKILALNAAVEAARAGAAGKGFSVVADEVRNLASKSAEAASSTTILIESSARAVQKGTKIAGTTAESLRSVADRVQGVVSAVNRISAASEEQKVEIEEVSVGIQQISNVVQTVSATAQESSAASDELTRESRTLRDQVSLFRVQ